ncbi:MAG: 50S ribosomal protein L17 [Chloroflexi bacterium]|nr:50S ribosomal protein L17 [Chloroflexota bacterium]
MRHLYGGRKLGRPTDHRLAMLRNLMTDFLRYEHLRTTEPKAEEVQREVEKLITRAREGSLHAYRRVAAQLYDPSVVHKVMTELAPKFRDRPGGYTRLIKLGFRRGDAAPLAQLELVE